MRVSENMCMRELNNLCVWVRDRGCMSESMCVREIVCVFVRVKESESVHV